MLYVVWSMRIQMSTQGTKVPKVQKSGQSTKFKVYTAQISPEDESAGTWALVGGHRAVVPQSRRQCSSQDTSLAADLAFRMEASSCSRTCVPSCPGLFTEKMFALHLHSEHSTECWIQDLRTHVPAPSPHYKLGLVDNTRKGSS